MRNGYYPLIKYSIRILREIRGWLLSSHKALWLLTIRYFGDCPMTFILTEEEDRNTEYIECHPIDTILYYAPYSIYGHPLKQHAHAYSGLCDHYSHRYYILRTLQCMIKTSHSELPGQDYWLSNDYSRVNSWLLLIVWCDSTKKKQHARAYSGVCDHYSELFTRMVDLKI